MNPQSRLFLSTLAMFMATVAYACLFANALVPIYRFRGLLPNSLVFAASQLLPLALAIFLVRRSGPVARVVWACVMFVPVFLSLLIGVGSVGYATIFGGTGTPKFLRSVVVSHGELAIYQTDGGATTSQGILVRQERRLLPGLYRMQDLTVFYPARDVDVQVLEDGEIIIISPSTDPSIEPTVRHFLLEPLSLLPAV